MASNSSYDPDCDLVQRLARYRQRVAAEGRPHSVGLIDRAIEEARKSGEAEESAARPLCGQ